MLSYFADIYTAITEKKGSSAGISSKYNYYAENIRGLLLASYAKQRPAYPKKAENELENLLNLVEWCETIKEHIRLAIVDCGIECDTDVQLSEYGNKIRQIDVLQIVTKSLPTAVSGVPYSAQIEATGGKPPYKWELWYGFLPAGLSLSADGILSGTPTSSGAYPSLNVRLTDAAKKTITQSLSIYISPKQLTIVVTAPKGVVYDGQPHTATVVCYNYDTDPDCTTPLDLKPTLRYGSQTGGAVDAGQYYINITAPGGYLMKQRKGDEWITINRATATVTFESTQTVTYDGQPHGFNYAVDTDLCTPTVRYKVYSAKDSLTSPKAADYATEPPTEAGKYRVWFTADNNHIFTAESTGYKKPSGTSVTYLFGVLEITE